MGQLVRTTGRRTSCPACDRYARRRARILPRAFARNPLAAILRTHAGAWYAIGKRFELAIGLCAISLLSRWHAKDRGRKAHPGNTARVLVGFRERLPVRKR